MGGTARSVGRVAVLIIMGVALAVPTVVARADHRVLRGRGTVFGAYVQDHAGGSLIDAQRRFERRIGHNLRATRVYLKWDSSFPNHHVRWLKRRHRTIVLA